MGNLSKTEVPVGTRIEAIKKLLVKAGARKIGTEDTVSPDGVTVGVKLAFTLPVDGKLVMFVMCPPIAYPPNATPREVAQAERTAWGRLYQWLQVNIDLASDGFVGIQDVLLCWVAMNDGRPAGEWFWQGVKTGALALPAPQGAED